MGGPRRGPSARSTSRRPSARSASAPLAIACTIALPATVASAGPAITGRPHALAQSSRSSGIDEPPPTRWITSASKPATRSMVATVVRHVRASESRIVRVSSAGDSGTGWPVSRQYSAIRAGMSPGAAKRGSSGSITLRPPGTAPAAAVSSAAVGRPPLRGPCPPALLEEPEPGHVLEQPHRAVHAQLVGDVRGNASLDVIGAATSQPTSDHVPHEM